MLSALRSFFGAKGPRQDEQALVIGQPSSDSLDLNEKITFPFSRSLTFHQSLPIADWGAVGQWIEAEVPKELQARAWSLAEENWLLHFRDSLAGNYKLMRLGSALLLSSLDQNVAQATLDYMIQTRKRIAKILSGIAEAPLSGSDILIVFEIEELYYNYKSYYSPDGENAFSSGVFINSGCGHFVTVQEDLRKVEPVIAHEMTHACLSHLPIPLWLDEGLAVNAEHRLSGRPPGRYTDMEMHAKHLAFWDARKIQEFWTGESFSRTDDGNMLSYDLARVLVGAFGKDWEAFRNFVLAANWQDGGAEAAQQCLGVSLGACVAAILEHSDPDSYEPETRDLSQPISV